MDRPLSSPRLVLALLLLAASGIVAGGVWLSRREVAVRKANDHPELVEFAENLQQELRRLDDLHENHLSDLIRKVNPDDRAQTARDCEDVVGVARCSILTRTPGIPDQHVNVGPVRKQTLPQPTLAMPSTVKPSDFMLFDVKHCFDPAGPDHGWVKSPGGTMFFWFRRLPAQLRVLTVQPDDVRRAVADSVTDWLSEHGGSFALFSDNKCLMSPDGKVLPGGNGHQRAPESANWVLSLPSRYGAWKLAAWDPLEIQKSVHKPTIITASSLALLLVVLGGALYFQQRRALRLAAARVSFVNRVSHELRTPLTNIVLNLDVAADALSDSDPKAAKRLDLVREEAARLARLIDNVLVFSRSEQGKLKLRAREGDADAVVDAVLNQFAASFRRRGIEVNRECSMNSNRWSFDPDALAQIVANLLSNVEKYAPNGTLTVRTAVIGERFVLSIADSGPGIAAGDRQRVFEPFERVHDVTNEGSSGTGLGLSIARDLARQMAGELSIVDAPTGCAFELTLPMETPVSDATNVRTDMLDSVAPPS